MNETFGNIIFWIMIIGLCSSALAIITQRKFFGILTICFPIYLILQGIKEIIEKTAVLRSGRIITGNAAIVSGIITFLGGCLFSFFYFYILISLANTAKNNPDNKPKEDPPYNEKKIIRCPSCGKEKPTPPAGKYQCTRCGQRFMILSDGNIQRIKLAKA